MVMFVAEDGIAMSLEELFLGFKNRNKLTDTIVQENLNIIDKDKEKGMLKKGIVKEIMEIMERQANKLTNSKETLRKKLDIEKDIGKKKT